ncbi:DUF4263 domain-containing protein [Desulfobulbus sp. F4]|nr:DUF4263 domain-containing protein [Desulfobulbus sp. F4]
MMKKTYEIAKGPSCYDIEKYIAMKNAEFQQIIETASTEAELQSFFELHPSFVPGAWTPSVKSGHYPLHCALITQPELRGLSTKIPDFMWISTHSAGWFPTLIEIESPRKRIFKKDGTPTADFTQARNQLEQWRTWFNSPSNVQQFIEMYHIPDYMREYRQMKLHMILIYGRRSEFETNPIKSKDRLSFAAPDMELMSYDRLSCDRELSSAITVTLNKCNFYEAVSVPPTMEIGPCWAERFLHIGDMEKVIEKSSEISLERKKFLLERIPYWTEWARRGERGIINSGDYE